MNSTGNIKKTSRGKKWIGIFFLFIGFIMLSRQLGFFVPDWVISWPMALILIGLITGSRHRFKNPASFILIVIGVIFLLDKIFENVNFDNFAWPMVIMAIGLYLIVGRRGSHSNLRQFNEPDKNVPTWDKRVYSETENPAELENHTTAGEATSEQKDEASGDNKTNFDSFASSEDYLDTVSVFGGVKKNVVSRNFRGGEITTIMGGAEINFIQADIHGTVVLDVTQLFGGTKIIVPQQWKVSSEMVALFGGIEDRRPVMPGAIPSDEKVLVIKGTSIFGGIDIRSF